MWQLLQGNLGISFSQSTPVSTVLMERLPWTLLLTGTALVLTVADRHPARRAGRDPPGGMLDRFVQVGGVTGQSLFVPSVGHLPAVRLRAEPALVPDRRRLRPGRLRAGVVRSACLRHLVLPCLSLVLVQLGSYVLTLRSTLIDVARRGLLLARPGQGPAAPQGRVEARPAQRPAADDDAHRAAARIPGRRRGPHRDDLRLPRGRPRRSSRRSAGSTSRCSRGRSSSSPPRSSWRTCVTDLAYGLLDPRVRTA